MAGFTSMDDYIQETTVNRKSWTQFWNKNFNPTTAAVAGEWHFLTRGGGNPPADALFNTGTNLTFQQVKDTTANASSIPHGGNVSPDYKIVNYASAFSAAATTMPNVMMLVDVVGFYRVTSVTTTTAQSTTNTLSTFCQFTADAGTDVCTLSSTDGSHINLLKYTRVQLTTSGTLPAGLALATDYYVIKTSDTTIQLATSYANAVAGTAINITDAGTGTHNITTLLPRYTNGAGVQAVFWNTNATPLGAATPNLSIGYTNSAQTGSRATPTTLPIGKTAASNTLVLYSGTGSGKYGPFVPLQGGDAGIAKIDTIQNASSYVSGEYSVALVVPLLIVPMTTIGVASERDLINQVASMPRIYDGAALYWMSYSAANTPANSAFFGVLDFKWG